MQPATGKLSCADKCGLWESLRMGQGRHKNIKVMATLESEKEWLLVYLEVTDLKKLKSPRHNSRLP